MGRTFSFRQKLGGAFALLLSLIILHGIVAWLALQEYNNLFGDLRVVNQIVETTLRAHLNEKNYVLREDRHSAIIVQEELQQAQTLVNGILQNNSPLGKSLLQDMSISLTNYMNTFSQYVIYEDQHQALDSEEKRLAVILLEDINHLQEMSQLPEETRMRVSILDYIQERTHLSRSSVLNVLSALKNGHYIEFKRGGYLTELNKLPEHF